MVSLWNEEYHFFYLITSYVGKTAGKPSFPISFMRAHVENCIFYSSSVAMTSNSMRVPIDIRVGRGRSYCLSTANFLCKMRGWFIISKFQVQCLAQWTTIHATRVIVGYCTAEYRWLGRPPSIQVTTSTPWDLIQRHLQNPAPRQRGGCVCEGERSLSEITDNAPLA